MRIAIGSDHGGYELKEALKVHLSRKGHEVRDFGCSGTESVDYPDFGEKAAAAVGGGECEYGILICKTGIGMSIVGNKVPGVRAALCRDERDAEMSRRHNDANVLVLSGDKTTPELATRMVDVWLSTGFEGGRHARRVDKITAIERRG